MFIFVELYDQLALTYYYYTGGVASLLIYSSWTDPCMPRY